MMLPKRGDNIRTWRPALQRESKKIESKTVVMKEGRDPYRYIWPAHYKKPLY